MPRTKPFLSQSTMATLVATMMLDVSKFNHQVVGLPIPHEPTVMDAKRARWALSAMEEELQEFRDAVNAKDVLEASDALIDLVYFALGRLVEMGVPPLAVFEEVQRANMGKRRGELSKRPGAKGFDAVKPEGWTGPDHSWILELNLAEIESLQERAHKWDSVSPILKDVSEVRAAKGADYNSVVDLHDYFPFGHFSYAQMLHVKTTRIRALVGSGSIPKHEGLVDSVKDLINYAVYYGEAIEQGLVPATNAATVRPE